MAAASGSLAGGTGARYHSDVWRFDVTTTAWRLVDVAGPAPRRAHTATLLGDAMLLVGGGDGRGALGDVWRLALNNEVKWTKIAKASHLQTATGRGARGATRRLGWKAATIW